MHLLDLDFMVMVDVGKASIDYNGIDTSINCVVRVATIECIATFM